MTIQISVNNPIIQHVISITEVFHYGNSEISSAGFIIYPDALLFDDLFKNACV